MDGGTPKVKSPLMKEAIMFVEDVLRRMKNNECNEEQIGYMLENKGYFNNDSFVNYDEAMRILDIKSREKMLIVLKKHGVKMNIVNNQKVGFLRTEVEAVATLEQRPQSKRKKRLV